MPPAHPNDVTAELNPHMRGRLRCPIPAIWCGSGPMPGHRDKFRYTRKGKPDECMRRGMGACWAKQMKAKYPCTSVVQLYRVSEDDVTRFAATYPHPRAGAPVKVRTFKQLYNHMVNTFTTSAQKKNYLHAKLCTAPGNVRTLNKFAFAFIISWLASYGVTQLPRCPRLPNP